MVVFYRESVACNSTLLKFYILHNSKHYVTIKESEFRSVGYDLQYMNAEEVLRQLVCARISHYPAH